MCKWLIFHVDKAFLVEGDKKIKNTVDVRALLMYYMLR